MMPHSIRFWLCYLKCVVERKNQWLMPPGLLPRQKKITASWKIGLALKFGVKKFYVYLFSRNFTLCTRQQAPAEPSQWIHANSLHGICTYTGMGAYTCFIWINNQVQECPSQQESWCLNITYNLFRSTCTQWISITDGALVFWTP